MEQLSINKVANAAKWSGLTEIIAKLISPITSMVLARLLTPEAFGVVATITMIVTFAEIFTDAGFQKYLVQHEFKDNIDLEQSTTVAFWSNFILSIILWGTIGVFSESLARLVGNPGLGNVITIACISIPLAAFSSIQMARYKRDLDFKTLFKVRIIGILTPIVVTVPLAIWLRSYWALILGTIIRHSVNAIVLTMFSKWKPRFYYSYKKLKEMLSFSIWSMIESITIWMTSYIDIFIIGIYLNEYYLGIYKTSMTVVGQITSLITAAATSILFSSLSRLQNDNNNFNQFFLKFQKILAWFIIPLGVGIFCYRDIVTQILLGSQWSESSLFIGIWGGTSSLMIVYAHFSSELFRAKGKPRISVLAQLIHIMILIPVVLISVNYGFLTLCIFRTLVRFQDLLVKVFLTYKITGINPLTMIKNTYMYIIASIIMAISSYFLMKYFDGLGWSIFSICICIAVYIIVLRCSKYEKEYMNNQIKRIKEYVKIK